MNKIQNIKSKKDKPKFAVVNDDYKEKYMENHSNEKYEDDANNISREGQGSWG